jgi:DNA-binding transcriptional ArsR family regulator
MGNFSYNVSLPLRNALQQIEQLRRGVLLIPLPPKIELRLRWEAMVHRIYWILSLSGSPITRSEVVKILSNPGKKSKPDTNEVILLYKAMNYIGENWLVSPKAVTVGTISTILDLIAENSRSILAHDRELKHMLDYLQTGKEHPVIQAGIVHAGLTIILPETPGKAKTVNLTTLIFFYKYAYDIRRLIVLEEYFRHNLSLYKEALKIALKNINLTQWLEFFAQEMVVELTKIKEQLVSQRFQLDIPQGFFELTDRQKETLSTLENPANRVTNRQVQKLFKVSQITASRDLAKLTTLGLIYPHGKGRSIYYTKV